MDPLTALSVTGTIIQFLDFASKLLKNSVKLYKSSRGWLKADEELELITGDLQCVISKLQASVSVPTSGTALPLAGDEESEKTVVKICDEAAKIAAELLQKLNGVKVKDGKSRAWESIKAAVKAAWSEEEIRSLERRLDRLSRLLRSTSMDLLR